MYAETKSVTFAFKDDNIMHCFYKMSKNLLGGEFLVWLNGLSNTDLSNCTNAEDCVLLGFGGNEHLIFNVNFCILRAKQYI